MEHATPAAPLRHLHDLPAAPGLPLVGNLFQMRPARMHQILEGWAERLGSPFTFCVLGRRMVVWTDVELMHAVLRERPHRFRRYGPVISRSSSPHRVALRRVEIQGTGAHAGRTGGTI